MKVGKSWENLRLMGCISCWQIRGNVMTWNALMSACRPSEEEMQVWQEWNYGLACLESMRQESLEPSSTSCNVQLCCLEENAQVPELGHLWQHTLALFGQVERWFKPDRLALGATLGALARQLHWAGALETLDRMASSDRAAAAPDEVHYDLTIAACVAAKEAPAQVRRFLFWDSLWVRTSVYGWLCENCSQIAVGCLETPTFQLQIFFSEIKVEQMQRTEATPI
eukprot:s98_g28.t1